MKTDDGGRAFPRPASVDPTGGTLSDGDRVREEQDGMTLRDWFAGQALTLAGAVALDFVDAGRLNGVKPEVAAETAYSIANAMLAERAKERP